MTLVPVASGNSGVACPEDILIGRELFPDGSAGEKVFYDGVLHLMCFGPSGVGKGMGLLVPNLLSIRGKSIVVIDPKVQLAAMTAMDRHKARDNIRIIDPFGLLAEAVAKDPDAYAYLREHGLVESVGYSPLAGLDPDSPTFYDDAAVLSEAMIRVSMQEPHWTESAQGLLTGLLMLERIERGDKADLGNVRRLLTESNRFDKKGKLIEGLQVTAAKMVARGAGPERDKDGKRTHGFVLASLGARFAAETLSDEMESIRSTADTQTRWILSEPIREDMKKNGVDFRKLKTDDRPTTVYLILPSKYLETHSVWLRLAVAEALQANLTLGGRRVLMMLDEFGALGNMSIVQKLYGVTRDYRVQMWPVFQDLSQLKQLYPERWETLISNSGVVQSFRTGDMTTAEWLSKRSGQMTIMSRSKSSSKDSGGDSVRKTETTNESPTQRPTIFAQDLFDLPNGFTVTFWAGLSRPFMVYAQHFRQVRSMRARALPNPHYDGP